MVSSTLLWQTMRADMRRRAQNLHKKVRRVSDVTFHAVGINRHVDAACVRQLTMVQLVSKERRLDELGWRRAMNLGIAEIAPGLELIT
jgi:hypothetical protein